MFYLFSPNSPSLAMADRRQLRKCADTDVGSDAIDDWDI
jgi:hypothetical protein